ncbi:hypothetical protein JOM56_001882 [Amanita muscaria]
MTATTSTAPHLKRFQRAMESVYGNLEDITDPQAWTPPPKSGGHRGRYLWTDAFGVVNFLTLHREHTRAASDFEQIDDKYLTMARRLVQTIHDVLGRTRDGKSRLPGATDENPLAGGLRIGKIDEYGQDGDGQYHHYLTIWMFALNRLTMATGDPTYNRQAVALAKAIHPRFCINRATTQPRMVWKVSMDLSKPLVLTEGNLDPIDGYVTFRLLQATAMQHGDGRVLEDEIADYRRVMERKGEHFVSNDPLDLGMTLWTVHWFTDKEDWATKLADRCFAQIRNLFGRQRYLERDIARRLAFREFGTCLGIRCHSERAPDLQKYGEAIINAWEPVMGDVDELQPINRVMYAAALVPEAFRSGYFGAEPEAIPR